MWLFDWYVVDGFCLREVKTDAQNSGKARFYFEDQVVPS